MLDSTLFIFTIPLYLIFAFIQHTKKAPVYKQLLYLMVYIYAWKVIDLTLFPLPVQRAYIESIHSNTEVYTKHSFILFQGLISTVKSSSLKSAVYIIGGNLALLVPFGFFYALFSKVSSIKKAALYTFLVALSIESSQFLISLILGFTYRSASVDDLLLNTLGGVLGAIAYQNYHYLKHQKHSLTLKEKN